MISQTMDVKNFVVDAERRRVYDLGNNKLFATRTEPFGYWALSLERGALPEKFRGVYTSHWEFEKAIQEYATLRDQVIEEIKKPEKKKNG